MRLLALLLFTSIPGLGRASAFDHCLKTPLPAYLVVLKNSGLSAAAAQKALGDMCRDLKNEKFKDEEGILWQAMAGIGTIGAAFAANIPTVIATMLGGDQNLKDYQEKLSAIGKIRNRYERIRKVYELAVSVQGKYDYDGGLTLITPGKLINKAKAEKAAGQCRDFAKLLEWSLLQVNRSPTLPEEMKKWGTLDEDSFMAKVILDIKAGHAWVEVLLPVGVGDKQTFHKIHLDTTWYEEFAPLFPRRAVVEEDKRLAFQKECDAVLSCVEKVNLKKATEALNNPAPSAQNCD